MSSKYVLKIVLMGDGAVGKTTLRRQYMGEKMDSNYVMTIGADFSLQKEIIDEKEIQFQIWDLAGQPRFERIRSQFFMGAKGALLVFDLTRPDTFVNCSRWLNELQGALKKVVPFVLIGNKVDIRDSGASIGINQKQAQNYADQLSQITKQFGFNVDYWETCAIDGRNVPEVFHSLGRKIIKDLRL